MLWRPAAAAGSQDDVNMDEQQLPYDGNADAIRSNDAARRAAASSEQRQVDVQRFRKLVQEQRARWARTALGPMAGPIEHESIRPNFPPDCDLGAEPYPPIFEPQGSTLHEELRKHGAVGSAFGQYFSQSEQLAAAAAGRHRRWSF